jgi:hypothetical protein
MGHHGRSLLVPDINESQTKFEKPVIDPVNMTARERKDGVNPFHLL